MDFGDSVKYMDRTRLVSAQSPEAYTYNTLSKAFTKASERGKPLSESCCSIFMYNNGFCPKFVEGNHNNIKIVRQEDIAIFTALIKSRE